jgi:hypothetical protein
VRRPHLRTATTIVALLVGVLAACSSSRTPATSSPAKPSLSASAPASATVTPSATYPNAIVVMGHSGTTGANSDPQAPGTDAKGNSWATGDNPAVQSIYLRLLALNPAVRGRNTNLGQDGSDVDALAGQVDRALQLTPLPDLFMIQEVDNDMRCDGSDPDNYAAFAQTLSADIGRIVAKAPQAIILLVSGPPGTVDNYGRIIARLPADKPGKQASTGTGPCDLFDNAGKAVPSHWKYQDEVTRHYHAQLAVVCKQFPTCRYDGGALYRMRIEAADLASDAQHLSVTGHRKQAALEWKVLGLGS